MNVYPGNGGAALDRPSPIVITVFVGCLGAYKYRDGYGIESCDYINHQLSIIIRF